jgi:putative transcriptional regulator
MAPDFKKMTVFERIKSGLEDALAHARGELSLVTTELPAPPPRPKPRQIVGLRKRFRMSQAVFAATLNVSTKTVQSWEQGLREPSDAALRMLQVIGQEPGVVRMLLGAGPSAQSRKGRTPTRRAGGRWRRVLMNLPREP